MTDELKNWNCAVHLRKQAPVTAKSFLFKLEKFKVKNSYFSWRKIYVEFLEYFQIQVEKSKKQKCGVLQKPELELRCKKKREKETPMK